MPKCTVEGCDKPSRGRLPYCTKHHQRFRKYGRTDIVGIVASPAKDWLKTHVTYKDSECLKWPFHIGSDGYGRVHRFNNGSLTTASNLMCELAHGPQPSEKHEAAHSCGNGNQGCVNPVHLYWALPKQNQADRLAHNTSNRGSRQGLSKLTNDDIYEIRRLSTTLSQADIARRFNVGQDHISRILSGQTWGWLI